MTAAAPTAAELPAAAERTWADRLTNAVPVVVAFLWLSVLYGWQTRGHVTPWLFTDELKYTQIARSIAETGRASERHHSVAFDTLYTYFIAPFWWIHDVHTAYSAIKYFGVIGMTSAIFPTYLLARMVLSRFWALFAAIGAVAGPALAYGSFVIEEPFAYPATRARVPADREGAGDALVVVEHRRDCIGAPRHARPRPARDPDRRVPARGALPRAGRASR